MSSTQSKILGEVEWTLRNADGTVARQGHEQNLYTRTGRRMWTLPTYVFIHNSEHPAGINQGLRCLRVDTLTPTPQQAPGFTLAGYTRTFTGSFAVPSAQRTIRGMGFVGNIGYAGTVAEGGLRGVSAYLKFTTPVVQETDQTFEYVYKQTLVPNLTKSLRRFQSWTPLCEATRASIFISTTPSWYLIGSLLRATWGSHYFVDGGLYHRGLPLVHHHNASLGIDTAYGGGAEPHKFAVSLSRTLLTTGTNNNNAQGPYGMMSMPQAYYNGNGYEHYALTANETRSLMFHALASHEGTFTPVYKHLVGETYAWNVVGSIALSQGAVEVRGPYIPDEHKSPWHWLHYVVIDDSGDTDGGTEGTYHVRRMGWFGYPYPVFNGNADENGWNPSEPIAALFADAMSATGFNSLTHQIAFDGEFYWLAHYATGANARLSRWRAGSNEQYWLDSVGDNTRWQPFTQPDANSLAYGVASDGAGSTWLLAPSSVLASQKLYLIDNTKPGRHYQRPSAYVESESPQTFNVDALDEIHSMFPFTGGDVGKQIRFVNAVNGADSTRTITAYNGPNSVDVDGAAFVTETGITWHWVTVAAKATNAWPAACGSALYYDAANTRLWTHSASGLHYSNDGGVTWGTVDETTGLSTALAKAVRAQNGDVQARTFLVGNAGALYWIDTGNAVNKYVPGPSGPSGTHTRIAIASLPAPPGGYTTGTLSSLIFDPCAPDIAGDSAGALWIGQDTIAGRCFWRLPCGAFAGGASYGETSIGGSINTYLHASFSHGFCTPDGQTYMRSRGYASQWKRAYFDEATGTLSWANAGDVWFGGTGSGSGDIHLRDNGIVFARASTDTTVISSAALKDSHGGMAAAPITYRYDDVAAIWRPWHGSGAQFDARYGTTNGGKRDCHASWQSILKGQQPGNIELRFVQVGGATLPADEFVAGESFTFGAAFGVSRTNTQDVTWNAQCTLGDSEHIVENEAIKTVTDGGALRVYYYRATGVPSSALVLGSGGFPLFASGGANFGWMPARSQRQYRVASGGVAYTGNLPDSSTATYGPTTHSQHRIGLDLGASPPAISRLATVVANAEFYYLLQNYHRATADRGYARVYYSDDNSAWTEATAVRFQLNGAAAPDPGYEYVYVEHYPEGGLDPATTGGPLLVTFDLQSAGMSVGARTHRYWQIVIGSADGNTATGPGFGGVWAEDSNGAPIGLTTNDRIDEAHDADLGYCDITAIDFVQTRTGVEGQGGISTVDDGDADGRTNIVTIDSGTFEIGQISTTTDYLAWRESPGVGNGYIRRRHGAPGMPGNWTTGKQARSRIIAVTATTITVADDIIPDNLSGVNFEVRRPALNTTVFGPGTMPWWDRQTGYFQFDIADLGREFRVTRKGIIRLP